jgi:hypothetical protein
MERAVEVARELAQIPAGEASHLVHYPREKGLLDVLEERSELLAGVAAQWTRAARIPRSTAWSVLDWQMAR